MKFIFFGTPDFAAIILEKLINANFIPAAVVCNPDRPVGRKKIITPPPVKKSIINYESKIKNKIKILQPENLKSLILNLKSLNPDLFIVAAYSKIIPKEIIELPRLGIIGVHPSFLPKYRGATPIQSAILNSEETTGTTLYLIDEQVDHGPILTQRKLEIHNTNYLLLYTKLAALSANLLIETLPDIEKKIKNAVPQDETQATFTKKFSTKDAFVELKKLKTAINEGGENALQIERKIRALNPEPGVFTISNNKRIKLLEAEIINGKLKLLKIQVVGGKPSPFRPELIFQ